MEYAMKTLSKSKYDRTINKLSQSISGRHFLVYLIQKKNARTIVCSELDFTKKIACKHFLSFKLTYFANLLQ